jgi:23S rRNA-/tRNA-specific pseudouridylate synthase
MCLPLKLSWRPARGFWELPPLFEDDYLLALDKPADLPLATEHDDEPSLLRLIAASIESGAPWATARGLTFLAAANRVERDCSGVVLFAKTKSVWADLTNQFGSGQPNRRYSGLVTGQPREDRFEVAVPLAPQPGQPEAWVISPVRGKKSITGFEVRERFANHALLGCEPLTHRPGQISSHLRWAQLPLVADAFAGGRPLLLSRLKRGYRLRADREERPLLGRTALHVERVEIRHPVSGQTLEIVAPLPKDFQVALKYLRRYAS